MEFYRNGNEDTLFKNLLDVYEQIDKEIANVKNAICHNGCSDCCTADFDITYMEFFAILDYLNIKNAYSKYSHIAENISFENLKPFIDKNPCIFLNAENNSCDIYSVRPIICRRYGSVEPYDYCEKIRKNKLALEGLAPKNANIDIDTNIKYFPLNNGKKIIFPLKPIIYFFSNITEDGKPKNKRTAKLFELFKESTIADFVKYIMFPSF